MAHREEDEPIVSVSFGTMVTYDDGCIVYEYWPTGRDTDFVEDHWYGYRQACPGRFHVWADAGTVQFCFASDFDVSRTVYRDEAEALRRDPIISRAAWRMGPDGERVLPVFPLTGPVGPAPLRHDRFSEGTLTWWTHYAAVLRVLGEAYARGELLTGGIAPLE